MNPGVYYDLPHSEYHGLPRDIVSNSYLGKLEKCPAATLLPSEETPAMVFGRAFHSYLLDGVDVFNKEYITPPDLDRRTTKGKEVYAKASKKGQTIITPEDFCTIREMAESVLKHPFAVNLLKNGKSEVSVIWIDEQTGIKCKCRPDWLPDIARVIVDVKTTSNADAHAFTRSAIQYGYIRGAAWYLDGCVTAGIDVDAYIFVVVESKPPHMVAVYMTPKYGIEQGRERYRALLGLEVKCRAEGYPAYVNPLMDELDIPTWY